MYCTECGKEIRMNAKFCARCGARTDNPDNNATYPRQTFYANPAPNPAPAVSDEQKRKGERLITIAVLSALAVAAILFFFIPLSDPGTVNTDSIAEGAAEACSDFGLTVTSADAKYRGSFPYEDGRTLEVYDVTVDVAGQGKGKLLISYLIGEDTIEQKAYYPQDLIVELFGGGLLPDFDVESFSDEDIAAFADHPHLFKPYEQ